MCQQEEQTPWTVSCIYVLNCMFTWLGFSLQFAVLMWILTYVGACFNGLTIIILGML